MVVNVNDILTIGNKDYLVAKKVSYKDEFYYYLMDINNIENVKICKFVGEKFFEVNNPELLEKIMILIGKSILTGQ